MVDAIDRVIARVDELRRQNEDVLTDRTRIRDIMNGGASAISALLGDQAQNKLDTNDMPVANLLHSGLERLAQKLGLPPDVKVDARLDRPDSVRETDAAMQRERIVEGYDYNSRLDVQLPQASRWIAGYGFCVWTLGGKRYGNGYWYPHAQLRDPYDCYPGAWGPEQQPPDMAVVRRVDEYALTKKYPQVGEALQRKRSTLGGSASARLTTTVDRSWDANRYGVAVAEYYDEVGTWLVVPETGQLLEFAANPLQSGPAFVIAKRFSFDQLQGSYTHVLGLMAMMAKLNILAEIATEDAVFRETNIIGDILSGKYRKGRFAYNFFAPGTRIEKFGQDIPFAAFQQIDRVERQLRVTANYNVIEDAISPNSFVTGQGLDRLGQSGDKNITEYQTAMRFALETLDAKRLEWDEQLYRGSSKPLEYNLSGNAVAETYDPKVIKGRYRTRRVYGVMAGWDDSTKIITGLQLLQGRIIDRRTLQENLHGMENLGKVNERIDQDVAEESLYQILTQQAINGDPAAQAVIVEIATNPKQKEAALRKYFTPEEPQLSPEEQQFLAAQQAQQSALAGEQPPPVTTVLSRLEGGGGTEGGVQTVGRL